MYPAAVGVAAAAIGVGWLLERTWRRSAVTGIVMTTIALAAIGAASWWLDSIRDTRRIVVTAFVEARWVGGLDPSGLPRMAVFAATLLTIAAAIVIRMRVRMRNVEPALDVAKARGDQVRRLAALAMVAVSVGLAPATIERAVHTWQPQAYDRSTRSDARFERIEVYPAGARAAIATIEPRSIVLAGINDTRRIASLAPVRSVEESALRKIVDVPPTTANAASVLDALIDAWKPDYLAASSFDRSFKPLLDAAAADPCRFESIASGPLRIYRLRGDDSCI